MATLAQELRATTDQVRATGKLAIILTRLRSSAAKGRDQRKFYKYWVGEDRAKVFDALREQGFKVDFKWEDVIISW